MTTNAQAIAGAKSTKQPDAMNAALKKAAATGFKGLGGQVKQTPMKKGGKNTGNTPKTAKTKKAKTFSATKFNNQKSKTFGITK